MAHAPASAEIAALLDAGERRAAGAMLDHALTVGHHGGDLAELCRLHEVACDYWAGEAEKQGFHRTHAYVYALEAGQWDRADALFATLSAEGRI